MRRDIDCNNRPAIIGYWCCNRVTGSKIFFFFLKCSESGSVSVLVDEWTDQSAAPHVLLICINWQRQGLCEDMFWQQDDLETMFIWWAFVAHPLSCGLTHKLLLFSCMRWALHQYLLSRFFFEASEIVKRLPLHTRLTLIRCSFSLHLKKKKNMSGLNILKFLLLFLHRQGWVFNRSPPVQPTCSVS